MAELFNTAIEQLRNLVSPGQQPLIIGKAAKQEAAAAVLVSGDRRLPLAGLVIF